MQGIIHRPICFPQKPSRSKRAIRYHRRSTCTSEKRFLFMLTGLLILDRSRTSVFGLTNYCQWSALVADKSLDSAYYDNLYLFSPSSCTGSSCTITSGFGGTSDVEYLRPSSSLTYTCDGTIQYEVVPAGSDGGVSQKGYICSVSISSRSPSKLLTLTVWQYWTRQHFAICNRRSKHSTELQSFKWWKLLWALPSRKVLLHSQKYRRR